MSTTAEALATAAKQYQAGDLRNAEQICRQILQRQPEEVQALHLLGLICRHTKRLSLALQYLRLAIRLQPDFAEGHHSLGQALQEQGQLDEAVACYRRAVTLKPDHAEAYAHLGAALRQQGLLDEAAARYREAARLRPEDAGLHAGLGEVLLQRGDLDEAVAAFRRVLQLEPLTAGVRTRLATALQRRGRRDEALATFREALRLNPNDADAHEGLGDLLREPSAPGGTGNKEARPVRVEVSPGELLDKIGILEIKSERIHDPEKLRYVRAELAALQGARAAALPESAELTALAAALKQVNEVLWQVEDDIRVCEQRKEFGPEFVELARAVYRHNDRRGVLKRQIDELLGAAIREQKAYAPYE